MGRKKITSWSQQHLRVAIEGVNRNILTYQRAALIYGIPKCTLRKYLKNSELETKKVPAEETFRVKEAKVHKKTLRKVKKFSCRKCPLKFKDYTEYNKHRYTQHRIPCPACDRKFVKPCLLKMHVRAVHMNNNDDEVPEVDTKALHETWVRRVGGFDVKITKASTNKFVIKCSEVPAAPAAAVVKLKIKRKNLRSNAKKESDSSDDEPIAAKCVVATRGARKCVANTPKKNVFEASTRSITWISIKEDGWYFDCYGRTNDDCCKAISNRLQLKNHIRSAHMRLEVKCQKCEKVFKKRRQFGRHFCCKTDAAS